MVLLSMNCAFSAQWLQDGRQAPLYPSIITTEYQGKIYPITAVTGEIAEVEVEGKLRELYAAPSYKTPRAVGFAPGYVHFKDQHASSITRTNTVQMMGSNGGMTGGGMTEFPGGTVSKSGDYECTLVSSESEANCYLAVVFYRVASDGSPDLSSTALAFRQIGDLVAGRETKVAIHAAYVVPPNVRYYFFPLIYSKGLEIRTDQSEISAQFFRRGEMAAHEALLARYRQQNPGADRPATPYLRFQPQLPIGTDTRTLPAVVTVKFAVTESGEVDSIEIAQVLDEPVDREIRRAVSGWLFLPRLKKGYPVRSFIEVPLSFEQAAR